MKEAMTMLNFSHEQKKILSVVRRTPTLKKAYEALNRIASQGEKKESKTSFDPTCTLK